MTIDLKTNPPATRPRGIRVRFGAVFLRAYALMFGLLLMVTFLAIRRWLGPKRRAAEVIVFMIYYLPRDAFFAFLFGALAALAADLMTRLFVAPLIYRWLRHPEAADAFSTPIEFALASRESLVEQTPARLQVGRRWQPGRLVLTTARLGFVPRAWDGEARWTPVGAVRRVGLAEPPAWGGRMLQGIPEVVAIQVDAGTEARYAVEEPRAVVGWFRDGAAR